MATGDAAAAAGLETWASTDPAALIHEYLNQRGDELANHMSLGTHPFTKITGTVAAAQLPSNIITSAKINDNAVTSAKINDGAVGTAKIGSKAVTNAKIADKTVTKAQVADTLTSDSTWTLEGAPLRLRTPSANHGVTVATTGVDVTSSVEVEVTVGSNAALTIQPGEVTVDATAVNVEGTTITLDADVSGGVIEANARRITLDAGGSDFNVGWFEPHSAYRVYSDGVRVTTTSAGANMRIDDSNGVIQRSTSSRKYKRDIEDAPEMPNVLNIQPRTWRDKNAAPDDERRYFGAIAEELDELGLGYFVSYVGGEPEAIAYDRIALALIPYVRLLMETTDTLLDRVAALEAGN